MRVGVVGPFPPYRGGIAQFSSMLADALESVGCDVARVTYEPPLYPRAFRPSPVERDDGEWTAARVLHSANPLRWWRDRRRLKALDVDAWVVNFFHAYFAPCLRASLPRGAPIATVVHNVEPHEPTAGWDALSRWIYRKSDVLVSHDYRDYFLLSTTDMRRHGGKVLPLYHPAYTQYGEASRDAARAALGYFERDKVVLFFGLVREYKGVADLARAMRSLPSAKLLIVGENRLPPRETAELRRALSALSWTKWRWVDKFVPDVDVSIYFAAADVVALPYRRASQSGVASLALAQGRPLVVSDAGGLAENVAAGDGEVFPAGDVEALERALSRELDRDDLEDLEERLRARAKDRSWDRYARLLLERLERLERERR